MYRYPHNRGRRGETETSVSVTRFKNRKGESMKNFKKKVALLLALAMLLSVLPMNVFGNPAWGFVDPVAWERRIDWVDVHINYSQLAGQQVSRHGDLSRLILYVELVGDIEWATNVTNADAAIPGHWLDGYPGTRGAWRRWYGNNWGLADSLRRDFDWFHWDTNWGRTPPAGMTTVPGALRTPSNPIQVPGITSNIPGVLVGSSALVVTAAQLVAMHDTERAALNTALASVPGGQTLHTTTVGALNVAIADAFAYYTDANRPEILVATSPLQFASLEAFAAWSNPANLAALVAALTPVPTVPVVNLTQLLALIDGAIDDLNDAISDAYDWFEQFAPPPNNYGILANFSPTGRRTGAVAIDVTDEFIVPRPGRPDEWVLAGNFRFPPPVEQQGAVWTVGEPVGLEHGVYLTLRFGLDVRARDTRIIIRLGDRNGEVIFNNVASALFRQRIDLDRVDVPEVTPNRFHDFLQLPNIRFEETIRGDLYHGNLHGVAAGFNTWQDYILWHVMGARNTVERDSFFASRGIATGTWNTGNLFSSAVATIIERDVIVNWTELPLSTDTVVGPGGTLIAPPVHRGHFFVDAGGNLRVMDTADFGHPQAWQLEFRPTFTAWSLAARANPGALPGPGNYNRNIPGVQTWVGSVPNFYDPGVMLGGGGAGGLLTIQLTAPAHYRWSWLASPALGITYPGGFIGERGTFRTNVGTTGAEIGEVNSVRAPNFVSSINAAGQNVLTITVDANTLSVYGGDNPERPHENPHAVDRDSRTDAIAALHDVLILRRLVLIPLETAPQTGDVVVRVQWGHGPNLDYFHPDRANNRLLSHRTVDLTVGYRTGARMTFRALGDELPRLRSGRFDDNVVGYPSTDAISTTPARPHVQVATLELSELFRGDWDTRLGANLTFTIDQPGVEIVGARYRVYRGGWGPGWRTRWGHGNTTLPDGNMIMSLDPLSNVLSILPFFDPHVNVAGNHVRRMELQLYVSIEADHLAAHGNSEIQVTVGGLGAAALPVAERTVTAATLYDPITVTLTGGINVIEPIFGMPAHSLFRNEISDIVIRENETGIFAQGSWIQVYAVGTQHSPFSIEFITAIGAPRVNAASGLRLSPAQPFHAGHGLVGVQFQVLQASSGTPAEITLTNNNVASPIFPSGEELHIVVVGGSIAENNNLTWAARSTNRNAFSPNVPGIFFGNPYARPVIRFEEADIPSTPEQPPLPPPNGGGGVTPPPIEVQFSIAANTPNFLGVANPVISRDGITFLSARAFAYLAAGRQGEDLVTYVGNGVGTIRGYNRLGQPTTLTFTIGSPSAMINIGGNLMNLPIPAPIRTGGRIYIPITAIADAFGFGVRLEAGVWNFL
jgi:hypothetical protein